LLLSDVEALFPAEALDLSAVDAFVDDWFPPLIDRFEVLGVVDGRLCVVVGRLCVVVGRLCVVVGRLAPPPPERLIPPPPPCDIRCASMLRGSRKAAAKMSSPAVICDTISLAFIAENIVDLFLFPG
jgi:hypothetical protein